MIDKICREMETSNTSLQKKDIEGDSSISGLRNGMWYKVGYPLHFKAIPSLQIKPATKYI